LKVTELS